MTSKTFPQYGQGIVRAIFGPFLSLVCQICGPTALSNERRNGECGGGEEWLEPGIQDNRVSQVGQSAKRLECSTLGNQELG